MNNARIPNICYLWYVYLIVIICRGKWRHFKTSLVCLTCDILCYHLFLPWPTSLRLYLFKINFVNNTVFLKGKQISCLRPDTPRSLQPPSTMSLAPQCSFFFSLHLKRLALRLMCVVSWLQEPSFCLQSCFITRLGARLKYWNCFLNSLSSEHSH